MTDIKNLTHEVILLRRTIMLQTPLFYDLDDLVRRYRCGREHIKSTLIRNGLIPSDGEARRGRGIRLHQDQVMLLDEILGEGSGMNDLTHEMD